MTTYYRVLPYLPAATDGEPGHPMFVPTSTGANRVDNPGAYDVLYLGDSPQCAVAEAFGWAPRWNAGLLRGSPALPGSVRALVAYDLGGHAAVCDLDDADRLASLGLRPPRVVTRDREVTQAWARELFEGGQYAGVRWWSYYNPDWGSVGLWDSAALHVTDVVTLTVDHPAFVAAAAEIIRIIE
ncbi:MAG: hypothetical protein BGO26_19615 [Actinobacteria bacterium 69-20]|nr:RES family NAD+ phosphorylase [Actinomycetota bacterium]OJV24739.1 MAG: hypothetical protein BGO26_19615 [Actinobacteria bacterium 69-20]